MLVNVYGWDDLLCNYNILMLLNVHQLPLSYTYRAVMLVIQGYQVTTRHCVCV